MHVKEKSAELAPIAPDFFVVNSTKGAAVKDFREELRRRCILDGGREDPCLYMGAFMPFCFQGLCAKTDTSKYPAKSLFFIFAAPEDGMRKMLEVFRKGGYFFNGKSYVFSQIYEHRLGHAFAPTFFSPGIPPPADKEREDNRLAYPLLDWEVEEDKFQGRLTRDEIRALMCEFPTWFYKKMLALKLVDHDAYITAVFKQKSRPLDGGSNYKHSCHVVFEVGGVPTTTLSRVCDRVFGGEIQAYLAEAKKAKDFSPIPDATLRDAYWIGADLGTMRGKQGFAVMFSRKNPADPSPRLLHRAVFHQGQLVAPTPASGVRNPKPFHPASSPHDLASLSEPDALSLLYQGLCSVPKYYTSRLSLSSEEKVKAQQSRTAAKHHAASGDGGCGGGLSTSPLGKGSSYSSVLPAWMLSSIVNSGKVGYVERRESAATYYTQLMGLLGEEERGKQWVAVHIGGGAALCPQCLSEDPPRMVKHRSNGVIVALVPPSPTSGDDGGEKSPSVVYARCTSCDVSPTTNPHVTRLERSDNSPTRWVALTKEGVEALLVDGVGKGTIIHMYSAHTRHTFSGDPGSEVCTVKKGSSLSSPPPLLSCFLRVCVLSVRVVHTWLKTESMKTLYTAGATPRPLKYHDRGECNHVGCHDVVGSRGQKTRGRGLLSQPTAT